MEPVVLPYLHFLLGDSAGLSHADHQRGWDSAATQPALLTAALQWPQETASSIGLLIAAKTDTDE